jgi:hypothetical protein
MRHEPALRAEPTVVSFEPAGRIESRWQRFDGLPALPSHPFQPFAAGPDRAMITCSTSSYLCPVNLSDAALDRPVPGWERPPFTTGFLPGRRLSLPHFSAFGIFSQSAEGLGKASESV